MNKDEKRDPRGWFHPKVARQIETLTALHRLWRDRPAGVTLNEIDIHIRSAKAGDLAEALAFVEEHKEATG